MLIISKKRLYPPDVNMLTLKKNDNYFYISRDLYDQAVILSYKFKNDWNYFIDIFGRQFTPAVTAFKAAAPEPINILAPFLLTVTEADEVEDIESLTGALHQIFRVISALSYLSVPAEVRATISFSLSIFEEYQSSWDSFFVQCAETPSYAGVAVTNTVSYVPTAPVATEEVTHESHNSYGIPDDEDWDLDLVTDVDELENEEEEQEVEVKSEPEPEPVEESGPVKSGLSFLRNSGMI